MGGSGTRLSAAERKRRARAAWRRLLTVGLLGALGLAGPVGPANADRRADPLTAPVAVEAHRGGSALGGPENSLVLFRKALAEKVNGIEFDVQFTKDLVPVVNHDDTIVNRDAYVTSGGVGVPARTCTSAGRAIHTMLYAEVARVRCGDEPLPTLDEVLQLLKGAPVRVNLEVKAWAHQPAASQRTNARLATTAVLRHGMSGQVMIASFNWRTVAATMRRIDPHAYLIGLDHVARVNQPTAPLYANARRARTAGLNAYGFDVDYAQRAHLTFIRQLGLEIELYDFTSRQSILFAVANGQNRIGTDDPADTFRLLDALDGMPTPSYRQTTLTPWTSFEGRLRPGRSGFAKVIGVAGAVPASAQRQLDRVDLTVTVTSSRTAGTLSVGPRGAGRVDGGDITVLAGTQTYHVLASPGDYGDVRLTANGADVRVVVTITGYRNVVYEP